jgi:2-haloacid dehalogenase
MPPIREIVFDLGAVLVDWNPRYLYRRLIADPAQMEWFLTEVCHHDWNLAQDGGRSWADAEAEAITRHPDQEALIRAYRAHWIEMIGGPIDGTVAILETLHRAGASLTALSNWAADTFLEAEPRFPFLGWFRGRTVSGRIGMVKPHPEIFHHHCAAFGITPETALFIDDNAANIATASALGFQTHLFRCPTLLNQDLKDRGLPTQIA